MGNATDLTKKYRGKEQEFWTPCIVAFLEELKTKPESEFQNSIPICNPKPAGPPWYESRKDCLTIDKTVDILHEKDPEYFLQKIEDTFKVGLKGDEGRYKIDGNRKLDIAGIAPDIIVIDPIQKRVYLLENKPYDSSSFTGNQDANGDYVRFVNWLNDKHHIHTEYLIIHSIGVEYKFHSELIKIKKQLNDKYGSILLEDMFHKMAGARYKYKIENKEITEWGNFTDKGSDYTE